jgi:lambda family phage portal protein
LATAPILASYYGEGFLQKTFYDGVEVNKYGKPTNYYFNSANGRIIRLGANQINHYFQKVRSTQIRGITEYARCIIDQKNLYAMVQAAIQTKRARMNVAYGIESAPNATPQTGFGSGHLRQTDAQNESDTRVEQINGVAVHYLRNGEKFVTIDPKVIGDDGNDLITAITRRTAAGRNVSYEFAFRDYTHTNRSSSRASNAGDNRMLEREQKGFIRTVMNPYYEKFVESQVLAGHLPITATEYYANKAQILSHSFIGPDKRSSDPAEDQKVQLMKLFTGETTLRDIMKKKGLDYEEQITQRNKEFELLGITPRDILISPSLNPQLTEHKGDDANV